MKDKDKENTEENMCGIVGYVGKNDAVKILLDKLKSVEYRGYDSAGISILHNNKITTIKECGQLEKLKIKVANSRIVGNCGIGHTRWATHGKPSVLNAHPHNSNKNTISIVHNGIIENFINLKEELKEKGAKFKSQTDTEVISHALHFDCGCPLDRIANLYNKLTGSYAIVSLFSSSPNKIYAIAKKSPLIIGRGDDCNMIASDITALIGSCKQIYRLNDGEVAVIDEKSIYLYDKELNSKKIIWNKIQNTIQDINLTGFNTYMEKEIFEIPSVMDKTASYLCNDNLIDTIISENYTSLGTLHFIGCGTALHSGKIAKLYCNKLGLNSQEHYASEFRYSLPPLSKNDLCIFISQSGETADTLEALKIAKSKKIKTCAVTNNLNSSITKLADFTIPLQAGIEISVASTKAYNCQLIALYILINSIYKKFIKKTNCEILNNFTELKNININLIKKEVNKIAEMIKDKEHIYFIGKDYDFITAQEASLKLKEISYIHCEAFPAGELKHGTLALIDKNSIVIAISTQSKLKDKVLNALYEVKSRGATTILITDNDISNPAVDYIIKLQNVDDKLYPFTSVIPCQLLALLVATKKGFDPDKPRNLAKSVTVE